MGHRSDKTRPITTQGQPQTRQFDYRKRPSNQFHHSEKDHLKNTSKSKQTFSVANIFATSKSMRRQRKKGQDQNPYDKSIINVLNDQLSEVGGKIAKDAVGTFDEALELHMENLNSVKEKDHQSHEVISKAISTFVTPLISYEGEVEKFASDSRTPNDLHTTHTLTEYKQIFKTERKNLLNYWKQWEDIHDEYLELGIEIFGQESFDKISTPQRNGFKNEMELLNLQHTLRITELEEEIEKLSSQVSQKMKKSEKDLDLAMKKEKNKLLASILSNI